MKMIPKEKSIISMSKKHEAVETVPSGSTVVFEAYDCFSNELQSEADKFSKVGWDKINPAAGPLHIEGAKIGDTLKVEILDIAIAEQGVMATVPGFGSLKNRIHEETTKIIPIKDNQVIFNEKLHIPINPMIGVIGTAPKEGEIPTGTPGDHGGNLDTKTITKGTTLYLPVNVPGALLAMGDCHAVMADGEVVICGLEIPAKIKVKVSVMDGQPYPLPFLENDTHIMTIASEETLDAASIRATENMHQFLEEHLNIPAPEAGMLLSLIGDLKISQIVNPVKTSRMELPKKVLEKYDYKLQ